MDEFCSHAHNITAVRDIFRMDITAKHPGTVGQFKKRKEFKFFCQKLKNMPLLCQ